TRFSRDWSSDVCSSDLDSNNIDAVNENDFSELMNLLNPAAGWPAEYLDDVAGNYFQENGTAIDEISTTDQDNKVYLVKLGYETRSEERRVGKEGKSRWP